MSTKRDIKPKRRRSRQAGLAMTEMVILVPILITMWFGIDYFRIGYARRLETLHQSQTQAWKLANTNDGSCFKNNEVFVGSSGSNDTTNPTNTGDVGASAVNEYKGQTKTSLFKWSHVSAKAEMKTGKALWERGKVGMVHGGAYIACNEVVPDAKSLGNQYADQDVITALLGWATDLF